MSNRGPGLILRLGAVAALVLSIGCSADTPITGEPAAADTSVTTPTRITADYLAGQPGITLDGFSFHLVDGEGRVIVDWPGLDITCDVNNTGDRRFELTTDGTAPDDIYLYAAYPRGSYRFAAAEANPNLGGEYLALSIPDRGEGLAALGLARFGDRRGTPAPSGTLATLDFTPGAETAVRRASLVTTDPGSAPELYLSDGGCLGFDLSWEEVNPGDCNNNGLVEVSDLTPVGIYYNKTAADLPSEAEFVVIDANGDGLITVADLTPIGRNYQCGINGYRIFSTPDGVINPDDSGAEVVTDVNRPATQRPERFSYCELVGWPDQDVDYYIRAYQGEGDDLTLGVASNLAPLEDPDVAVRPYWEEGNGILTYQATSTIVDITFSRAIDPNDAPLTYRLFVREDLGGVIDWFELSVPPYEYHYPVDPPGSDVILEVNAINETGYATRNNSTAYISVPGISTWEHSWGKYRCSFNRSGFWEDCTLTEPLVVQWKDDLGWPTVERLPCQPGIDRNGQFVVQDSTGASRLYDIDTGYTDSPDCFEPVTGSYSTIINSSTCWLNSADTVQQVSSYLWTARASFDGNYTSQPVVSGDLVFLLDSPGLYQSLIKFQDRLNWELQLDAENGPYPINTTLSSGNLWTADALGTVYKINCYNGEVLGQAATGQPLSADAMPVCYPRDVVILTNAANRLVFIDTESLETTYELPVGYAGAGDLQAAPCLVSTEPEPYDYRYIAVSGLHVPDGGDGFGSILAVEIGSQTVLWEVTGAAATGAARMAIPLGISAGADRIFVHHQDGLTVLSYDGNVLQTIELPGPAHSDAVLTEDRLMLIHGNGVMVLGNPAAE